jgi:putative ABC transport system permease protein
VLGYGLALLALPQLNTIFKSEISFHLFSDPIEIIFLSILLLLVIFLSGSYPGLVLSRFQPVVALKSKLSQMQVGGFSLRRILVITQFTISQMLIIGTIVIASQLHFAQNIDLGFNKKAIVMLPLPVRDAAKLNTMRSRIREIAGIEDISFCSGYLSDREYSGSPLRLPLLSWY